MSAKTNTGTGGPTGMARFLPVLEWLPNYDTAWLKGDIVAGLSVWALMVPTSLGYAAISGVPVQNGLYAITFGLVAFALFTTSKQATQGPSSSTAAVLGAGVLSVAAAGSDEAVAVAAAIIIVSGLLFVILYLLKMGWISEFLSASVLTGFVFGVAINVAVGELFKITGTEKSGDNTWQKMWAWIQSLPDTNRTTLITGIFALVVVFGLKFFAPRVPGALVAVILGVAATLVFNLDEKGVEMIGEVPRGLPIFAFPDLELIKDNYEIIFGTAVGLVLIGFSVTTATVRRYATEHNYRVDINQEMLAQGTSNIASGLFQGVFNNGSLSKSPVNDAAGARSQVSNIAQAVLVILTLLILAPLFSELPEAFLGAIIIEAVVMGLMDVPEMKRILFIKPIEFLAAIGALLGVLTFGILQGVVIGVVLSIFWLVAVTARPYIPELGRMPDTDAFHDLDTHPDGEVFPGLRIFRFDGGLIFVNADALADRIRQERVRAPDEMRGVILSMEGVNFIDTEGADTVKNIVLASLDMNIDLHLARAKPQVLEVLQRDGVLDLIGADRIHPNIANAVSMHLREQAGQSPSD